ncbi:MAG: hypothetical protein ACXWCY_28510 [Burkholderiales bacterium]
MTERLAQDGASAVLGDTPADYAAFLKGEIEKWSKVMRRAVRVSVQSSERTAR